MYHCLICRKKSCKKIPEYDKWFNKDQTAHNREDQTYPQDFSASAKLPGRVILAGKGGSCLTESSNHVIGKIFKVHGNGTACNCRRAKAVHRGKILAKQNTAPWMAEGIPTLRIALTDPE